MATIIMDRRSTTEESETTIHELGHLLGVLDHYNDTYKDAYQMQFPGLEPSPDCIYGDNKEDLEGIVICDACRTVLNAYQKTD